MWAFHSDMISWRLSGAMTMADRIVVMKDGIIQQIADPQTLYDKPVNRFVASFMGMPPMNFLECSLKQQDDKLMFISENLSIVLPEDWISTLVGMKDQQVALGVRPENIVPGSGEGKTQAKVEVVEPLGSETLLHLRVGGQALVVKAGPDYKPSVGEMIGITFEMNKAHVFNTETGITII